MAKIKRWRGDSPAVAQVTTTQVTAYDAATTYGIRINGKTVSVSGTTDANGTASALQTALDASTIPEFQRVTWTVATDTVTGTATTAGQPYTAASFVSGGTGTIGAVTTTTSSSGPNHVADSKNWTPRDLINSTDYQWTASGFGTNEYYLEANGGGDPGLDEPTAVKENGSQIVTGTAGSLTASTWAWADNDTLGFSTVYIRLSDGADPDSKASEYVQAVDLPVTGDTVDLDASDVDLLYDLGSFSAVTLTELVARGYSGNVGLPDQNPDGYYEYETTHWTISATTVELDTASSRFRLNVGSVQTAITVRGTGSPTDTGQTHAMELLGTHASNTLTVYDGSVASAINEGDVSTWATVRVGYETSVTSDANVKLGEGCTLTTVTKSGGQLETNSAVTTMTNSDGDVFHRGTGALTTYTFTGGTLYYESSGNLGTGVFKNGATINFTRSLAGCTIATSLTMHDSCNLLDPHGSVTWTGSLIVPGKWGNLGTIDIGTNKTIDIS